MTDTTPAVLTAIKSVQRRLSELGIGKDSQNKQQGFNFRGIDQLYNTMSTLLVEADLAILPHVRMQESMERTSKQGGLLIYSVMSVEYTLLSLTDGSTMKVGPFVGEAMDSGDKASNKAMSAAYKYMAIQTFCIPTVGNDDSDADSPEPGHESAREPERAPVQRPARSEPEQTAQRDRGRRMTVAQHVTAMREAKSVPELKAAFAKAWKEHEDANDPRAKTAAQGKLKEKYDEFLALFEEPSRDGNTAEFGFEDEAK